jgi:hypothetical protein
MIKFQFLKVMILFFLLSNALMVLLACTIKPFIVVIYVNITLSIMMFSIMILVLFSMSVVFLHNADCPGTLRCSKLVCWPSQSLFNIY